MSLNTEYQNKNNDSLLDVFAQNTGLNPGCFKNYPTKYDQQLAKLANSYKVVSTFATYAYCDIPGEPTSADLQARGKSLRKEIKDLTEKRNDEIKRLHKGSEKKLDCECILTQEHLQHYFSK